MFSVPTNIYALTDEANRTTSRVIGFGNMIHLGGPVMSSPGINFEKARSFLNASTFFKIHIYAEVVTFVAGSLEAGGLPGYSEVLVSLE